MIDKQLMRKRFSERAKTYDQFANVQKTMADLLADCIGIRPHNILEVGCGTGYLTEKLCRMFPHARMTAVDIAPGMIAVAQERVCGEDVTWICADIEDMTWNEPYDLIISNATFQWLNDAVNTIARLYRALSEGGCLVFSTFGARTFHELHTSFSLALKAENIHEPFRIGPAFPTLAEWIDRCQQAAPAAHIDGFEWMETERFPSVRDFFLSLRHIGATNSMVGRYCQRPSVFKAMMREYEQRFLVHGEITATYHCLLIRMTRC